MEAQHLMDLGGGVGWIGTLFIGAIMLMAQIGIGDPSQGANFTLTSITAVVLGGTSLLGVPMTLALSPLIPALSVWAGAWFIIGATVPISGWMRLVAAWPGITILSVIHHVARKNWVYFFMQQFPWWGMGVWWMLLCVLTRPRSSVVKSTSSFTSPDGWDILVV
mgnify:CR=1 FL=1